MPASKCFCSQADISTWETILITLTRSSCERTKFTRPGDFLIFLVFCGVVILVSDALDTISLHSPDLSLGETEYAMTDILVAGHQFLLHRRHRILPSTDTRPHLLLHRARRQQQDSGVLYCHIPLQVFATSHASLYVCSSRYQRSPS